MSLQSQLDHPCIVKVLALSPSPPSAALELCTGGSLLSLCRQEKANLPWSYRLQAAIDMAEALNYLQTRTPPVVHLDFKAVNVMVRSRDERNPPVCQLIDFGTSCAMWTATVKDNVTQPCYLAPERLERKPFDERVDTYAFGAFLWELVTLGEYFSHVSFDV